MERPRDGALMDIWVKDTMLCPCAELTVFCLAMQPEADDDPRQVWHIIITIPFVSPQCEAKPSYSTCTSLSVLSPPK